MLNIKHNTHLDRALKLCRTCNKHKPFPEFHKRKMSLDGLAAKCKKCQSDYDKARVDLPKRIESRKKYAQTEAGKTASSKGKKAYIARNPIKRKAHHCVTNAVRDGKLSKPELCQQCDKSDRLHGHHDDYAKPYEVRWLCSPCHIAWHKENGPGINGK